MELQKRLESLDYRYNRLQLPHTPRAARSTRRRALFKRKADDKQMCAFDLLATVAGRLLSDRETCPPLVDEEDHRSPFEADPVVKKEKDEGGNKTRDQDCCERNFIITEIVSEVRGPNSCSNEPACAQNDPASVITISGCADAEELANDDCKLRLGIFNPVDGESSGFRLSANCGPEDNNRKDIKVETANNNNKGSPISSGHRQNPDGKSSALVCSVVNNVKFPFSRDHAPCESFPVSRENVKLVSSKDDDDENSFKCTTTKATKQPPPPCVGDRRFRRLVQSNNHCKMTSNMNDRERYNNAESSSYPTKNKWQRSLRDYPFKKRKLHDCGSGSDPDEGGARSDGTCGAPEKGTSGDGLGYDPMFRGATQTTTSVPGGYGSFHSKNASVKLKIKSFKVPELYIKIPETATVGSLKKIVMEAVNSVLGGGLRVGVLLQGKKIRDDNKTLAQTGISHNSKTDSLGFTLEPSSSLPAPPIRLHPEDPRGQMICQGPQPLARYPPTARVGPSGGQQRHLDPSPDLPGSSFNNFMENDHDSDPYSPGGMSSLPRPSSESKALVPLSSAKQDALAVVPLRKSKRSESAQRRIRRPFTVAEVEALVQAVEKLGTGRWRDVKLRAFDSAKHRTYVDLKDKWKTLVHTARISPQQRRGEPVPQELLDRVLTAHAYWSQQQARQQLKSHPDTCLLL